MTLSWRAASKEIKFQISIFVLRPLTFQTYCELYENPELVLFDFKMLSQCQQVKQALKQSTIQIYMWNNGWWKNTNWNHTFSSTHVTQTQLIKYHTKARWSNGSPFSLLVIWIGWQFTLPLTFCFTPPVPQELPFKRTLGWVINVKVTLLLNDAPLISSAAREPSASRKRELVWVSLGISLWSPMGRQLLDFWPSSAFIWLYHLKTKRTSKSLIPNQQSILGSVSILYSTLWIREWLIQGT